MLHFKLKIQTSTLMIQLIKVLFINENDLCSINLKICYCFSICFGGIRLNPSEYDQLANFSIHLDYNGCNFSNLDNFFVI